MTLIEAVRDFLKKYPETKVICLKENNRSSQLVLDFAEDIIKNDKSRLSNDPEFKLHNIDKKLIAKNESVIKKQEKRRITGNGAKAICCQSDGETG